MSIDAQNSVSHAATILAPLFLKYGIDANTQQPLEFLLSKVNESELYGLFRLCNESEGTIKSTWHLRSEAVFNRYTKIVITLRDNTEFNLNSNFLIESLNQLPQAIILFYTSFTEANLDLTPVAELLKISPITLINSHQSSFNKTAEILNNDFGFTTMMFLREFEHLKHIIEHEFGHVLRDCTQISAA